MTTVEELLKLIQKSTEEHAVNKLTKIINEFFDEMTQECKTLEVELDFVDSLIEKYKDKLKNEVSISVGNVSKVVVTEQKSQVISKSLVDKQITKSVPETKSVVGKNLTSFVECEYVPQSGHTPGIKCTTKATTKLELSDGTIQDRCGKHKITGKNGRGKKAATKKKDETVSVNQTTFIEKMMNKENKNSKTNNFVNEVTKDKQIENVDDDEDRLSDDLEDNLSDSE